MQNVAGTVRYTLRQFRQSPVFTSAAILTLALGIGGTTAIFTLIHAVMLRSLPVSDPSLLYRIGDGDNCCVMGSPQERCVPSTSPETISRRLGFARTAAVCSRLKTTLRLPRPLRC